MTYRRASSGRVGDHPSGAGRVELGDGFWTFEAVEERMVEAMRLWWRSPSADSRFGLEGRISSIWRQMFIDRIALIEQLDMQAIADRRAAGFSHGERTKVAIARALVHEPGNVLLDEPTNGLDVMSTRAVREIVRRLRGEGRTVVFSSHVMQEVSALCDTIVVLARGRVVAAGTAEALRQQTGHDDLEDAFVALAGPHTGGAA